MRHGRTRFRADLRDHVGRRGFSRGENPRQEVHNAVHAVQRAALQTGPLRLGSESHQVRAGGGRLFESKSLVWILLFSRRARYYRRPSYRATKHLCAYVRDQREAIPGGSKKRC